MNLDDPPLVQQHCQPYTDDSRALNSRQANTFSKALDAGWQISADNTSISRKYAFKNYYQTIAFVNAVAWIANTEDHHPELTVSYKHCLVCYSTHSLGGLSPNDFICAAKIDALIQ